MNAEMKSSSGRKPLDVALQAAKEAGAIVLQHFRQEYSLKWKGKSNVVTDVDLMAERCVLSVLHREFPSHGVLAEESGQGAGDSPYVWTVDPLDGTNNFMFGLPFFCVNLALMRHDDVVLAVTYDPVHGEMFHAEKGSGAYVNGARSAVSGRAELLKSAVGFDLGYDHASGMSMLDVASGLWRRVHSLRLMGSAALSLAYVAAGRLDLYMHQHLYPWDTAAGILLVRESGGVVTDWQGSQAGPRTSKIIAGGPNVHREFTDLQPGKQPQ